MTSTILLTVAVLGLILLAVGVLRQHQFRRFTGRQVTREQIARLRDQKRVTETMNALLTELDQFAQRVAERMEAHLARLHEAAAAADERAARLERLLARPDSQAPTEPPSRFAPQPEAGPPLRRAAPAARTRTGATPPGAGPNSRAVADAARLTPPHAATAAPPPSAFTESLPPQRIAAARRRIYDLADQGATASSIAATVGAPLGEVELLLGLRELNER